MREELRTERLLLRPLAMADAPRISELSSNPNVARNVARIPHPNPVVAVEGWMLQLFARQPIGVDHVRALVTEGDGLIGVMGAHGELGWGGDRAIEIGYWLGEPYWNQGYATEALKAFVVEASSLGELAAGHFIDNPASGRVLEKAGFTYTGVEQDLFCLARGEDVRTKRMAYPMSAAAG